MVGTKGQRAAILKHFKTKKSLTTIQAFELYGCTRLASVVFDFRKAGYDIRNVWLEVDNRYGESCRYVKYVYKGKLNGIASN